MLLLIKSKVLVVTLFTEYFQGCVMNFHTLGIVSKIWNVTYFELSSGECQGASIAANVGWWQFDFENALNYCHDDASHNLRCAAVMMRFFLMIDFFSPGADVQSKVQWGACSQTIGMQGGTNPELIFVINITYYICGKNCHVEKFWGKIGKFWDVLRNFGKF